MRRTVAGVLVLLLLLALAAPVLGTSVDEYTIRSEAEYKELLRSFEKIPSDFTAWRNAESLGKVVGFSAISNGDAFGAGYKIEDKCGYSITLNTIYDAGPGNNEDVPKWTVSDKMTSMATVPDIWSEGKIVRGDFTYYYQPGANNTSKVTQIVWRQNGNRYTIGGFVLDIYNNPVIQGLLSLDEQEFRAARNKLLWNMTFTKTETVLICVVPIVLAVGVVAVIVVRKKRKEAAVVAPLPKEVTE